MSSKLILKGLNTEIIGNEKRLMWTLPLFEVDSKYYAVIKTPWSLEDQTSVLPVDIQTWLGSKIIEGNKEINANSVLLVFGADYYNLLKKYNYHHLFREHRNIHPIKPNASLWIGDPDNLIDWTEKLFSSLLDKLDYIFIHNKWHQKKKENDLLQLIKGTVGLVENDYLEFRIRELFRLSKYSEISEEEKTLFIEELALDTALNKQVVIDRFSDYLKQVTSKQNDVTHDAIQKLTKRDKDKDKNDAFSDTDIYKVLDANARNKEAQASA